MADRDFLIADYLARNLFMATYDCAGNFLAIEVDQPDEGWQSLDDVRQALLEALDEMEL